MVSEILQQSLGALIKKKKIHKEWDTNSWKKKTCYLVTLFRNPCKESGSMLNEKVLCYAVE